MATRKVRYKKLNIKTPLPVLREDQIDPSEYESLTNDGQIATGVEQAEENVSEHVPSFDASGHVPRGSRATTSPHPITTHPKLPLSPPC